MRVQNTASLNRKEAQQIITIIIIISWLEPPYLGCKWKQSSKNILHLFMVILGKLRESTRLQTAWEMYG